MQTEEFVILTYAAVSQYEPRALECLICRNKTNTYVTALTVLEKCPMYCRRCKRAFVTDFKGNKQKSVI